MIIDDWARDMPQQFQDQPNIEVLLNAFAKQLQEVFSVLESLRNRSIDNSSGESLDQIGSIVGVSRAEAYVILRSPQYTEITDSIYRQVLKFKIRENISNATYYEIMESLHWFWNAENIRYTEGEEPATISIDIPDASVDGEDIMYTRSLAIKSAGVKIGYEAAYMFEVLNEFRDVLAKIRAKYGISFWQYTKWDGSYKWDGTISWDNGLDIPVGVSYGAFKLRNNTNEIAASMVGSHDYRTYDGDSKWNGEHKWDAYRWSEEL